MVFREMNHLYGNLTDCICIEWAADEINQRYRRQLDILPLLQL